jgi:hypothetical protein
MYLELHDNEEGNSKVAVIRILEYDYQAEQWVLDTVALEPTNLVVTKWILYDDYGVRCVWERTDTSMPHITQRSARFTGEWETGPNEIAI